MEQLLLVNPRRRRRRNPRHRRNARKGRMPPGLAKYWATHRRGSRTRLSNPRRRRRNPSRSTMRHRHRHRNPIRHRRRRNPHHHHRRRHLRNPRYRRRNPRENGATGLVREAIVPALVGGAGALVTSVALGYVQPSLPTQLQSGWFNVAVQAVAAVGIGLLARRFIGRDRGDMVMVGALTVTAYSAFVSLVSGLTSTAATTTTAVTTCGSTVSDYTPFRPRVGAYMPGNNPRMHPLGRLGGRVGAYMPGNNPRMHPLGRLGGRVGYISPAAVLQPALSPAMGAYMSPMNVAPWSNDGM
jgi:hypothetical protein